VGRTMLGLRGEISTRMLRVEIIEKENGTEEGNQLKEREETNCLLVLSQINSIK